MAVLFNAVSLEQAIQQKREQLHELHHEHQSLVHPSVVTVSQQLDELIVQRQKQLTSFIFNS